MKDNEFVEYNNVIDLTDDQLEWSVTIGEETTGIIGVIIWLFNDEDKIAISSNLSGKDVLFININNLSLNVIKNISDNIMEEIFRFIEKNSDLIKSHAIFDLTTDKLIESIKNRK